MSDTYSITVFTSGIKYTVFFFASFSGHFHPWTPIEPLEIDDIHAGLEKYSNVPYYQGWYSDSSNGANLDKLIKYNLYRGPINIDIELCKVPGVYYHRLEKVDGEWKIGVLLTKEMLIEQENYFRYVVNKSGKVEFAYRIYATPVWRVEYAYKENGALNNVINLPFDFPENIPN